MESIGDYYKGIDYAIWYLSTDEEFMMFMGCYD